MERDKDWLAEAVARLKQEGLSEPLPRTLVDETVRRLAERESQGEQYEQAAHRPNRVTLFAAGARLSLAAALIVLGYALGRNSIPESADIQELHLALLPALAASLEAPLQESIVAETTRDCRQAMAAVCLQLKDELTEQYRTDLNRFAVQIFAASNTVTNQLLERLLESVEASQLRDRHRFAVALEQVEAQRAEDTAALGTALVSLAVQTDSKLQRTREEMARLLAAPAAEVSPLPQEDINHMN
jgi:hypothetical protein